MSLFKYFRFPLMFRFVHERRMAELRFDIEALQKFAKLENERFDAKRKEYVDTIVLQRRTIDKNMKNHTAALSSMNEAYQTDKSRMRSGFNLELAEQSVMEFATFRQGEVRYV